MEQNIKADLEESKREIQPESSFDEIDGNSEVSFSFSQLLKDAGKQSLKALKWFLIVLVLFIPVNTVFLLRNTFNTEQFAHPYLVIILSLVIGFISVFLAFSRTYQFIVIDALSVAYKYLTPFFKKLSIKVVDMVVSGGNRISGKDINKSLNVGALMVEVYGKKAPKYVQKGLVFIVNRIPFSDFLKNMQKDLSERKDNKTLSEILYKQLHGYITSVFTDNSIKSVFIILALNIIFQIAVILLLK